MAFPSDDDYRETVRDLSDRLVAAQAEIRVLDAVKWTDDVRDRFFADRFKEQPAVDAEYYERRPLSFDVGATRAALIELEGEIGARLGTVGAAAQLMLRMCGQYRVTVDMLAARGTSSFSGQSAVLYGTPADVFHVGGPSVLDFAGSLSASLDLIDQSVLAPDDHEGYDAAEAVTTLQGKLDESMGPSLVNVKIDDGIVADAAAGSDYVKLRTDAHFSELDLAVLEAHEGWVHVGTTLNGLAQPVCTFLGKASPTTTVTQEGLAVLTEILSFRSHPARLARIVNRIKAVDAARDGATFLDVFERMRTDGLAEDEAYAATVRVFRGSLPTEGPFAKDLAYGKGLVLTYAYLRIALRTGRLDRIPMLFCGKVDLQALDLVSHLFDEGLVEPPRFVPPTFRNLEGLAAQIAFSRFLRDLDFDRLEADYARLF